MTLRVYSARLGRVSVQQAGLDITRSGAQALIDRGLPAPGEFLAPSWRLLRPFKSALKAAKGDPDRCDTIWERYERTFLDEQRARYRGETTYRAAIAALFDRDVVILMCVCADEARCHRGIVRRRILPAFGAVDCGEIRDARAFNGQLTIGGT